MNLNTKKIITYFLFSIFCVNETFAADNLQQLASTQTAISDSLIDPLQEEIVFDHLQEAYNCDINPVELAIQKNDMELAELLLSKRSIELSQCIFTFDFPGYKFSKPYNSVENCVMWMKRSQVNIKNANDENRCFYEAKIDVELLTLFMKYDEQNLWRNEIKAIFKHAYQRCDLTGVLFCLQFCYEDLKPLINENYLKPSYLVDPFLSEFPISYNDPNHYYISTSLSKTPFIWDFKIEDSTLIHELKKQIQSIVFIPAEKTDYDFKLLNSQIESLQKEIEELKQKLQTTAEEDKKNCEELKRLQSKLELEIVNLKNELLNVGKAKEEQIKKQIEVLNITIEVLNTSIKESLEMNRVLATYGNNPEGVPALHYAISKGDLAAVQLLVKNGADVNARDGSCGALTALIKAIIANKPDIAEFLIEKGADVNANGHQGAIYYATIAGKINLINLLIKNGAEVNTNYTSYKDVCTLLHIAAEKGHLEAVKALVNAGADINFCKTGNVNNFKEGTPLDRAIWTLKYQDNPENLTLVIFLVENGATRRYESTKSLPCPVIEGYLQTVGK